MQELTDDSTWKYFMRLNHTFCFSLVTKLDRLFDMEIFYVTQLKYNRRETLDESFKLIGIQ